MPKSIETRSTRQSTNEVFPLDIVPHRDGDTGATVERFVHRKPSQEQLFYYCSPSISDDGRFLPCWSNVSGTWQVHAIDRQEKQSIQLSHVDTGQLPEMRSYSFPSDHPCFSREYNRVFYHDGKKVWWSDLLGKESGWLFEIPAGYDMLALSARGRYLTFSYVEKMAAPILPDGQKMASRSQLAYRPRSIVVAIDIETGAADYAWGDHSYLGHVEMCPFDDELIMFTDQSWERRQQEVYVVRRSFTEDKRAFGVLAPANPPRGYRGRTLDYLGHSFFTQDGFIAGQYTEYGNVDGNNQFTDMASYNLVIKPDGTCKRKAKFPGSGKPVHVHCQRAEGLWVGDYWIHEDGTEDRGWISLMRNKFDRQEMSIRPLLRTNHSWQRPFHPHAWIHPSETQVVLAYNTGQQDNHLAIIDIPEKLCKTSW